MSDQKDNQGTRDMAVTALNKIEYHIDECTRRYRSLQSWLMCLVGLGGLQIIAKVIDFFHK